MTPHDLAAIDPPGLSDFLCAALERQDVDSAKDALAQIESRFHRGQRFLDDFLPLAGRAEVRALHLDDPLAQCVARLEHLLELAGDSARVVTEDAILRQIVDSRERGGDLIQALAAAPEQGLTAGELAQRLGITPQNLSPLIAVFHAQGIVNRSRQGKKAFITLTPEGRALLPSPETAPQQEPAYMFLSRPMGGLAELVRAA